MKKDYEDVESEFNKLKEELRALEVMIEQICSYWILLKGLFSYQRSRCFGALVVHRISEI